MWPGRPRQHERPTEGSPCFGESKLDGSCPKWFWMSNPNAALQLLAHSTNQRRSVQASRLQALVGHRCDEPIRRIEGLMPRVTRTSRLPLVRQTYLDAAFTCPAAFSMSAATAFGCDM